ncbi:hypothetical protein MTR_3g022015 [Medicago truncatula]|uniref:Uncharacterized protein n=1 Tax=Medicago truncatula TaxID=3880 RepID=A0A072UUN3_MEDTR|nr:hypothetical protein MTR_3g022015 [Medicago truncatula]
MCASVRTLKAVLILFEATDDLKVSFNKSLLVGVNVSTAWLAEASTVLNCKTGIILFTLSIDFHTGREIFYLWGPLGSPKVGEIDSLFFGAHLVMGSFGLLVFG